MSLCVRILSTQMYSFANIYSVFLVRGEPGARPPTASSPGRRRHAHALRLTNWEVGDLLLLVLPAFSSFVFIYFLFFDLLFISVSSPQNF